MVFHLVVALTLPFLGPGAALASDLASLDRGVDKAAKGLTAGLERVKGKVCVLDFISLSGDKVVASDFGHLVAEKLSAKLVERKGKKDVYEIVDRLQLVRIMDDTERWGGDLDRVNKLMAEAGMDYLVSGTYNIVNEQVSVTAKLIAADSGKILGSAEFAMKLDPGLDPLFASRQGTQAKKAPSDDGKADRLRMDLALVYMGKDGKLRVVHEGMSLTSRHYYGVYVRPDEDCYLYVYQVDSQGTVARLFPNPAFHTGSNLLKGGEERWVPNDAELFELDEVKGQETIYFVASRRELARLSNMAESGKDQFEKTFKALGLMGVKGTAAYEVRRVRPIKGTPAELAVLNLASDKDHFSSISFNHQ
ncbi:MAG: DUF4384 domain-containing protein [Elusimicrobia bacterium]|nr:DUF4384 domain-containing protein [Elusimicrobiota bacterium]